MNTCGYACHKNRTRSGHVRGVFFIVTVMHTARIAGLQVAFGGMVSVMVRVVRAFAKPRA